MRALLVRFVTNVLAVLLVTWGVPRLNPEWLPHIDYGNDWWALGIFAAVLALVNTFIRPIIKALALPITCLTAGLFGIVINIAMFFLAAWITNQLGRPVTIDWIGALLGAIAVAIVGAIMNMVVDED